MYCVVPVTRLCQSMYSNVNITTYCVLHPSRVGHFLEFRFCNKFNKERSKQNRIKILTERNLLKQIVALVALRSYEVLKSFEELLVVSAVFNWYFDRQFIYIGITE